MVTYNCTGLYEDRAEFIENFMHENDVDVVFLQETWLHEAQFKQIKGICKDYLSHSVSGIKDTEIIKGKKGYGGVTVLWRTTLAKRVTPLKSNSKKTYMY